MASLDLLLKSLVILAAAGLITVLFRTASASFRHFVWFLALVCLLLLPVFSWFLPAWRLPVVPVSLVTRVKALALSQSSADTAAVAPAAAASTSAIVATTEENKIHSPALTAPAPQTSAGAREQWTFRDWTMAVWLAGTVLLLARLMTGTIGIWSMKRRARPVSSGPIVELVRELSRSVGISTPVALLQSPLATMPMTWGFRRAVVLLPQGFAEWDVARQRAVVLHELAHVKRWDCLTQTVAWIVCAVYWFNPLAWLALRRMRVEREWACDDVVLGSGAKASDYADHLLEIARRFRTSGTISIAAIAIAKPTQLEGRLLAILDGHRRRDSLSRMPAAILATVAILFLLPVAAFQTAPKNWTNTLRREISTLPPIFAPKVDYPLGGRPAYSAIADLDGDGRLDVLVQNEATDGISVFRNLTVKGANEIQLSGKIDLRTGKRPFGVLVEDIDGDGRVDVAAPCHDADFLCYYRNTGSPGNLDESSFSEPVLIPCSRAPQGMAMLDLNGDRRPDTVVANNGNGRGTSISIFENTSIPGRIDYAPPIDIVTGLQPTTVTIDDLDGDGANDIVVGHGVSKTICVLPNLGGGAALNSASFPHKIDYAAGNDHNSPIHVVTADLDGDDRPEVIVGNLTSTAGIPTFISIWPNMSTPGDFRLGPRIDIPAGDGGASCTSVNDVNGDGWPDLTVGNHFRDTVSIFLNRCELGSIRADSFAVPVRITVNAGSANLSVADLDADNRADLVVPCIDTGAMSILKGL